MNQYKTPKAGGATRIKETFEEQRKRQPSKTLWKSLRRSQIKNRSALTRGLQSLDAHAMRSCNKCLGSEV